MQEDPLENDSDEEDEKAENGPKKKKRRRKNRKRNKKDGEPDEDGIEYEYETRLDGGDGTSISRSSAAIKVVNLEYVDEGSTQCISKLSEEEFDKNFNQYAQRLEKIEQESMEYLKNRQLKLIPNLRMGWIEQIREDFN